MMTEPGTDAAVARHMADPSGGSPAGPPARVTLLTRVGCHLCDQARAVLARLAAENGFGWDEIDVDADPERADTYGDRVPVIMVDGREHGYWRVEEARLLRALSKNDHRSGEGGPARRK